jgi:methionyl-tRNA synthetase
MKKFYITTAIDYVNSNPHIGHAYEKIAADVVARYYRTIGDDVLFQVGTDEHGLKIYKAAKLADKDPQKFTDEVSQKFQKAWKNLDISFDNFVRTTNPDHETKVKGYLEKLKAKGLIYKGEYSGFYCVSCEEYKKEEELEDGNCPVHKKKCEKIKEEVYFFKLSKFKTQIYNLINSSEMIIEPESRKNEVLSFLKDDLKDVAISRSKVKWGIPVPWDKNHTIYVWVDALFNYITGENDEKFWPANIHIIGKDIIRFHCVIWPAILLALEMDLPKKIFAHGYLTVNGEKMSKTTGNVIDPNMLVSKYGANAVRYFLLREFPFGTDGDFSESRLQERYSADLANDLGNLVQRVLKMINQNKITVNSKQVTVKILPKIAKDIEDLKLKEALDKIWELVVEANQSIDKNKPWELAKSDSVKLEKFLQEISDKILLIAENLKPFLPNTSQQIFQQFKDLNPEVLFPKIDENNE